MRTSSVRYSSLYSQLLLVCVFSILLITPSLCRRSSMTHHHPITLPLSKIRKHHHHHHPTLPRHHKNTANGVRLFATSLSEEYIISLPLGSPPQSIPVLFDTGSDNIWVPCGTNYSCSDCDVNASTIVTYKPDQSSSVQAVTCDDQKCQWLDTPLIEGSCLDCNNPASLSNCSSPCSYFSEYGLGNSTGQAVTDKLQLPSQVAIDDLFFGCSTSTGIIDEGIVGFGRLPASLPSQLKLSKFAYCLVSHDFDDNTTVSSNLMLGDSFIPGLWYTPFVKNPPMVPFTSYYYVHVTEITVGGKHVNLPYGILLPNATTGDGGTIVDSGTTFTYMVSDLFGPVMGEFNIQLSSDLQERSVPPDNGLSCFNVSGEQNPAFPEVVFYFKGGAKIALSVENYVNDSDGVLCLPLVLETTPGPVPAITFGNYHQQNYYLEYDLKHDRLGMKKHNCA